MKNIYLLILLFSVSFSVFAQSNNPFDARSKKARTQNSPGALLQKADVIDGSKSASSQEFLYKGLNFSKSAIVFDNRYDYYQGSGQITPTVIFLKEGVTQLNQPVQAPEMAAFSFLTDVHGIMKIANPAQEFVISSIENDKLGMQHIRLNQVYKNIPVLGAEVIIHGKNGKLDYLNGNYYPTPENQNVNPAKSMGDAILAMSKHIGKQTHVTDLTELEQQILNYKAPKISLVIYPEAGLKGITYKLAYQILVRPNFIEVWNYFVDANDLSILDFYNGTCQANGPRTATANDLNGTSRTINTYEYNGKFYCVDATKTMFNSGSSVFPDQGVGVIETFNANNTDGSSLYNISTTTNSGWTATTVSAQYTAGVAYDYYKSTFNRNSINGSGGTVISIINVTQNGAAMDNAYWNGQAMFYGNGNVAFKPLAGAIDVGGHEMTHGVVQATANLEYKSQSGAINESMADVFGCMMDRSNWKMGETITKTSYISTGCLRDLSNPHNGNGNGYQPAKMSEYNNTTSDNGGVHANSGIPNFAFYLFATATSKNIAEQVYYRALTSYLTKTSQFLDLRYAVVKAAGDLYGASSAEVNAAKNAFDQVEIFDPNGNSGGGTGGGTTQTSPKDLPVNPGADYIISYDLSGAASKLYRSSTTGTNYIGLTATDQNRRVTIPDNGSYCVFADLNGNLRTVNLTSSPYTETTIYTGGDLSNVAISKDGKMLAAVSTSIDTAIYVYNFALSQWKKLHLYNPTYSGVNGGGVDYADGLEWDNTGQYIIYDAHNMVKNNTGANLEYWDVGIIKAWDLKSNGWGDGKIEKLFTNLPEGVSIGNPAFAKNSPYIIAFDYIDVSTTPTTYAVLGTNIITNTTKVIATNNKLGFPNYSKSDNKILIDGTDATNADNIYVLNLGADKLTASGASSIVIPDGKWGYWYAMGTRALLSDAKDILAFSISNTSPAVTATISGTTITATVPATANLSSLIATFSLSYDAGAKVSSTDQLSGVSSNNFSNTVTYTVTAQDGSTKNYTVIITKAANGINSNSLEAGFSIFPNPCNTQLSIDYTQDFQYEILDATGKCIVTQSALQHKNAVINTAELSAGIYFLKLNSDRETKVFRVVKE